MYVDLYVAFCEHFGTFWRASDASILASFSGTIGESQAPSMLQMRRLEAPADHKPRLDQHQRRELRSRNRETRS